VPARQTSRRGLSPAEIRRLDTATEEEIEAFVGDRDFCRLAEQYAAVRELPLAERPAHLLETAWQELWNRIDVGDRCAFLFIVYQASRARHPVRQLVRLVTESLDKARQPYERPRSARSCRAAHQEQPAENPTAPQ
jgi:hypothetical protein